MSIDMSNVSGWELRLRSGPTLRRTGFRWQLGSCKEQSQPGEARDRLGSESIMLAV